MTSCALKDLNALHFTSGASLSPRHALKSFKGAFGNYFHLIKPFRNHLNGLITCSGENGDFPRSSLLYGNST